MKLKAGFMLKLVADSWIVVPIGERVVEFSELISLSESGALLWKLLEQGSDETEMLLKMREEYEVDMETARKDIKDFIALIESKGFVEN